MTFEWQTADGLRFSFEVQEPCVHSAAAWRKLALGRKKSLNLYQGNGQGSISNAEGDKLEFVAQPSGGGGDVTATILVPRESVAAELCAAVDTAVSNGWKFGSF